MVFVYVGFVSCGDDDDGGSITNPNDVPIPPEPQCLVSNGGATDIKYVEATIIFTVVNGGNLYSLSEVGIVYGTENNTALLAKTGKRIAASSQKSLSETSVQYTVQLTGLSAETTYYYFAYAGENTASGNVSFKTLAYSSCPDSRHPHKIDLGLPSGTLWSCCNIGASVPNKAGVYYAWGDVKTKSSYTTDTYYLKSGNGMNNYVYLGADIAGTKFDAATANWGAPWCIPSKQQCEELINNTHSEWTIMESTYGRKIYGSNGNYIFVPAAGFRYDTDVYFSSDTERNEAYGYYWLSTASEGYIGNAYEWTLNKDQMSLSTDMRHDGHSIRPVCK